ncbi:MAG: ABC transporter ATP-binding protein [Acidimicrobiia bacterium]|nr:ABC transporter ATP-binding protein [Acidimicrobiia bacterium]
MTGPILEVEVVTMRFGGVVALHEVSLEVRPGTVTGVIGPNGAGKTTLFDVVTGFLRPTSGHVRYRGRDVTRLSPHRRAGLGLRRTFQGAELFDDLSVRENIAVARSGSTPVDDLLERFGLDPWASDLAESLPAGIRRRVGLVQALAGEPGALLLDEPAAGLDEAETSVLADELRVLAGEGLTVLIIDHDMSLMGRVCSELHVLDFGELIARGAPEEVLRDSKVLEAYLG